MNREEISEYIRGMASLYSTKGVSATEITNDTNLITDLELDSVAILQILLAVENEIGIKVPLDSIQMDVFKNFGSFCESIVDLSDQSV